MQRHILILPLSLLSLLCDAELAASSGADGVSPILGAVDGLVFDFSAGRDFYGPGGGYSCFAARDATIGLATMNLEPATWAGRTVAELTPAHRETLDSWVAKFMVKYKVVGCLKDGARPTSLAELQARLVK